MAVLAALPQVGCNRFWVSGAGVLYHKRHEARCRLGVRKHAPQLLTRTPLAALLVARLPLMLMARHLASARDSVALGLDGATTLSLIVAGVLSVVLFPIVASGLLGPSPASRGATYSDHDGL